MAKKNGFACPFVLRRRRQLRPLSRIKGVRNRYIINIYAWAQKKPTQRCSAVTRLLRNRTLQIWELNLSCAIKSFYFLLIISVIIAIFVKNKKL